MKHLIAAAFLAVGLFVTTGTASAQHHGGYTGHGGHHVPRHYGHGGYRGYAGVAPAVGVYAGPVVSPGVAVYAGPVVSPGVVVSPGYGHGHYRHHGHH